MVDKNEQFKRFEHTEDRPSLFDGFSKNSWISQTPYRGLWRLLIFAITIGLAIDALANFLQRGFMFEMELCYKLLDHIPYLFFHWSALNAYAHVAFFLQKLLTKSFPLTLLIILQHITQSSIFIFAFFVSYNTDWVSSHYLFLGMATITCFFKMHAYTSTNIELYRLKLEGKCNDYPKCITYKKFLYFMVIPTFVYQVEYPKVQHKRSILYVVQKLILAFLLILKVYHIVSETILPIVYDYKKYRFLSFYLRLVIPISIIYLLSCFITFDLLCNSDAEIFGFADRNFYGVIVLIRIIGIRPMWLTYLRKSTRSRPTSFITTFTASY